ncbi:MAG TPA: DUF4395 family protein [Acidimicrobiia bacterium]|nr:DUF4395 family protein [Acidimicrobiia bacterium]
MDADRPESAVDARAVRFELAALAVVLLGAFVFRIPWAVPALAVIVAVGVGFGARGNLFRQVFAAVAEDRLGPVTATESARAVRFSELFAVAMLTLATLVFALDIGGAAWLLALVEAGVCAVHATTGISVEAAVRRRLFGGGNRRR